MTTSPQAVRATGHLPFVIAGVMDTGAVRPCGVRADTGCDPIAIAEL